MKTMPDERLSVFHVLLLGAIPYVAVLIGMYWFKNGVAAMFLYHMGMVAGLVYFRHRCPPTQLVQGISPGVLLFLLPLYAAPGVLIYFFWDMAGITGEGLASALKGLGISSSIFVWFSVHYMGINSVLEEWFWRGLLREKQLRPSLSDWLFAGYHGLVMAWFVTPVWIVVTVVLLMVSSWVWRIQVLKLRGLFVPWVTHFFADASIIVAVLLLSR